MSEGKERERVHNSGRWTIALVAIAGLALALTLYACGDGGDGNSNGGTPEPTSREPGATFSSTPASEEEAQATVRALETAIGTALAQIDLVPGISEETTPGWTESGEAGTTLDQVCAPQGGVDTFVEKASRLGERGDQRARSSAVYFVEQSQMRPYAAYIFTNAADCATQLAEEWFGEAVSFGAETSPGDVGDESVFVESDAGDATALFFRIEEAVGVVMVLGGDSTNTSRELASIIVPLIDERLSGGLLDP